MRTKVLAALAWLAVLAAENNARIIDLLAPAMEGFPQRPELIFANGFQ